jgi:hypothetical protein
VSGRIAEGAFVKVLFPTDERPREPGLLHLGYVLAVRPPLVLLAYTTSRPWPEELPRPFGLRRFDAVEARALNQRPFTLHLQRQAKLVLSARWFPELEAPGQGVVAVAPAALREELFRTVVELERRHRESVRRLGV